MKNPIKPGDKFTIATSGLSSQYFYIYRDCSEGTVYECINSGLDAAPSEPDELDVLFIDDKGDGVMARYDHLNKV